VTLQTLDVAVVRSIQDIHAEIERVSELRAELWRRLGEQYDAATAAELKELDARLASLWDEHRAERAQVRFGDRERIIARARAEERLERAASRPRGDTVPHEPPRGAGGRCCPPASPLLPRGVRPFGSAASPALPPGPWRAREPTDSARRSRAQARGAVTVRLQGQSL
jgi:hypothetical protein